MLPILIQSCYGHRNPSSSKPITLKCSVAHASVAFSLVQDLHFFADNMWKLGMNLTAGKFLFLGDYVDRGLLGLECLAYLFSLKVRRALATRFWYLVYCTNRTQVDVAYITRPDRSYCTFSWSTHSSACTAATPLQSKNFMVIVGSSCKTIPMSAPIIFTGGSS